MCVPDFVKVHTKMSGPGQWNAGAFLSLSGLKRSVDRGLDKVGKNGSAALSAVGADRRRAVTQPALLPGTRLNRLEHRICNWP